MLLVEVMVFLLELKIIENAWNLRPTNKARTTTRIAIPHVKRSNKQKRQTYAEVVHDQHQQGGKTEHKSEVKEFILKK